MLRLSKDASATSAVADVEGVCQPRAVVGLGGIEPELDEDAAQEVEPQEGDARNHRRDIGLVAGRREGDLDRGRRRLVDRAKQLTVVRSVAGGGATKTVRPVALGVSAVLLVRGVAFVPVDLADGLSEPFARWDLAVYSPLCLALGAGTLFLARRT